MGAQRHPSPRKPDPLQGKGFDDVLQAQRERINRLFRRVTVRAGQRFLDTTPLEWSMRGNTKGAWGRGAKSRGD